jgi:hypothetical protein
MQLSVLCSLQLSFGAEIDVKCSFGGQRGKDGMLEPEAIIRAGCEVSWEVGALVSF